MKLSTYDHTAYRVYGYWLDEPDGTGTEMWCWIGQGPAESLAPIIETCHGPHPSYEAAVDDARIVHGAWPGRVVCLGDDHGDDFDD